MLVGGYKTLTPIQIANLLHGLRAKEISWPSARVFFACTEMLAVREAAARTTRRRIRGGRMPVTPAFDTAEVVKMSGLSRRVAVRAISQLSKFGLMRLSPTNLDFASEPMTGVGDTLEALSGGRSSKRPIPVPRRVLRFLAQLPQAALGKVMLGYLCRGMVIGRKDATVRSAGTVKASWLSEITGLSIRSVRYARAHLQRSGWIDKDTGSKQWKLNRHGSWFRVNLAWSPSVEGAPKEGRRSNLGGSRFAPRGTPKRTGFAPLKEDGKTLSESKNQETHSGLLKRGEGKALSAKTKPLKPLPSPRLSNIHPRDLSNGTRLSALFDQAAACGWVRPCEAERINFFAAAVRAVSTPARDPVRVFVSLVRRRLWGHVTQAQEDAARKLCLPDVAKNLARPTNSVVHKKMAGIVEMLLEQMRRPARLDIRS
jgi:hypothetical protein